MQQLDFVATWRWVIAWGYIIGAKGVESQLFKRSRCVT
jgi:hypothetical protein